MSDCKQNPGRSRYVRLIRYTLETIPNKKKKQRVESERAPRLTFSPLFWSSFISEAQNLRTPRCPITRQCDELCPHCILLSLFFSPWHHCAAAAAISYPPLTLGHTRVLTIAPPPLAFVVSIAFFHIYMYGWCLLAVVFFYIRARGSSLSRFFSRMFRM